MRKCGPVNWRWTASEASSSPIGSIPGGGRTMTSVSTIREDARFEQHRYRQYHRDDMLLHRRAALGQPTPGAVAIGPEEVADAARRLQHRSEASLDVLRTLRCSFLQTEENIGAFLGVRGALHSLVREMCSKDAAHRLEAVHCCCNLALADEKACFLLTKVATPYLLTSTNGQANPLVDACAWSLGNLAAGGPKAWSVLHSQGVLARLTALLASHSRQVVQSTIYALTHYVSAGFDELQTGEQLADVARSAVPLLDKEPSIYWLLFLLSCAPACVSMMLHRSCCAAILRQLLQELRSPAGVHGPRPRAATALLRMLANVCGHESGEGARQFTTLVPTMRHDIGHVVSAVLASPHPHLRADLLWWLGNVFAACPQAADLADVVADCMARLPPHLQLQLFPPSAANYDY